MKLSFSLELGRAKADAPPGTQVAMLTPEQQEINRVAVNPERLPFDPGPPLPPRVRPEEPIIWAPPVGWNLLYTNQKKIGVRNEVLQQFADQCVPIRVVLEQLKREMRGLARDVVPVEEGKPKPGEKNDDPKRDRLRAWIRRPDPRQPNYYFGDFINQLVEDLHVIGAVAIARLHNVGGQFVGLRPLSATTVVPYATASGLPPEPPAIAYEQNLFGLPYTPFSTDELIYRPYNRRTWTPYGFGPVEFTLLYVIWALNRGLWHTNTYSVGNLPPGFFEVPKELGPTGMKELEELMTKVHGGNTEGRHQAPMFPEGTKYSTIKQVPDFDPQAEEIIFSIFAWACGVSATPIKKQGALGGKNSEGLQQEALAAGIRPLQDFFEEILDDSIQSTDKGVNTYGERFALGFGEPDYTFEWVEEREENKAEKLAEVTQLVDRGMLTRNQGRQEFGLDPTDDDLGDTYFFKTQGGYTPVDEPPAPPPQFGAPPVPPTGKQPPQLPEGKQSPEKPPVPPVKGELKKWREVAKKDARAGRQPRRFESDTIPAALRFHVEKLLAAGDVAKAFKGVDKTKVHRYSTSPRAKGAIGSGIDLWTKVLRLAGQHLAGKTEGKFAKADDLEDFQLDSETLAEIEAWLAAAFGAGVLDAADLVGGGTASAVEYARERAATLLTRGSGESPLDTLQEVIRQKLADSIEAGQGYGDFRKALNEYLADDLPHRAELIARTETGMAYNSGALANYREQGVERVEILDGSGLGDECDDRNGSIVSVDEIDDDALLLHPNCLEIGTLVTASDVQTVFSREFHGEMVILRTAADDLLSCTPNHPILTYRGWVAAGELVEGDDVIRCADPERLAALFNPDNHEVQARIEDIADAILKARGSATAGMPCAPEAFHGDGAGSDVYVVGSARSSESAGDAATLDHSGQSKIVGADVRPAELLSDGTPRQVVSGSNLASDSGMSGGCDATAETAGSTGVEGKLGGAVTPNQESANMEEAADGCSGDTDTIADAIGAFSSQVVPVKLVNVERRKWSGHVYNLQTASGWYVANCIVTHNCTAAYAPVVIEEE